MSGNLMPTVRTTCTDADLCKAIIEAWYKIYNTYPSKESVGVILAQHNLETGSGAACWNWNVSNVKYVVANGDVDYCMLPNVWEMENGVKVVYNPPSPQTFFRSFPTLADGVMFQINFLRNNRYKTAWTAVESGNPGAFAHLLKLCGYYTAPEQSYVNLINVFFNKFMKSNTFEICLAEVQAPVSPSVPPTVSQQEAPAAVVPAQIVIPSPTPQIVIPEVKISKLTILETLFNFILKLFKK